MPAARPSCVMSVLLAALLLLPAALPVSAVPQDQKQPPPAASMLTPEQKAELERLLARGNDLYRKGDPKAAQTLFQQGLDRATMLKDALYEGMFLHSMGNICWVFSQFDQAKDYFLRALALREKIGDPRETARTLNNLAAIYYTQGLTDKALETYLRAFAIKEKGGDPREISGALNNLGIVYNELGQYDKALDCLNRALALREKLGDPALLSETFGNLAMVYNALGQFDKVLDYNTRSLTLFEKAGNPMGMAIALQGRGVFYNELGQNDKALDAFTRALALFEKLGNTAGIADVQSGLGQVYHDLGQDDKARDYLTRALAFIEKVGNPVEIARTLRTLGAVCHDQGEVDTGLEYLKRASSLFEKVGYQRGIADVCLALGAICHDDLNQYDKALEYFQRSMALFEKSGDDAGVSSALSNMGVVYDDMQQDQKAVECFTRALAIKEKRGNPLDIAFTLQGLGVVYYDLGRLEEAEQQFVRAKQLRESQALQVSDPAQVGALQEKFYHFYERYAQVRLKRSLPEEALEILEAGKGQGLTRQIDLTERGDVTRLFTAAENAEFQQKARTLRDAQVRRRKAEQQAENAAEPQRAMRAKLAETAKQAQQNAEQQYDLFRDTLFARYPQLREVAENRPAKFARLQTLTQGDARKATLYLEWGIVDKKTTLLFALGSQDKLKTFTLKAGKQALGELARQWRDALERAGGRGVKAIHAPDPTKAKADEAALAKQAYQMLLGEAEKAGLLANGRYKRIVFVGSGPILEMPLSALCDAEGRRLIERFTVAHAFSLSSFFYKSGVEEPTHSLLCVADPTGAKESGAPADPKSPEPPRGGSVFRGGFLPLPGARSEGKAVASLFAGSKLLIGPEAREGTVTDQMKDYKILHFATHGYLISQSIQSSGLVLAEEPEEAKAGMEGYDGLLTVRKIVGLSAEWKRPMAAQLTVLSACETGRGMVSGGEGLMGLAWAFRAAGCPSLVVSQWAVNDEATREWMLAFYGALKAGKSKDEAVQIAMLAVKKDHPSPYFWAAFELIGDTMPIK